MLGYNVCFLLSLQKHLSNMEYITIEKAVNDIKVLIENSIREGGVEAKNNLIRTQVPINKLHNAVKAEFIANNVNPTLINPPYGTSNGEIKLSGFFKTKNQDICIFPNDIFSKIETLNFDGILKGKKDPYGFNLTEQTLSVNVRSQLSSVAKNFDTLYERTFAESLNLHLRCEKMVLGEFYMIPVYQYDDELAKEKKVAFKANHLIQKHIEKYLYSFGAINQRDSIIGEEYKYERVCLLVVDFSKDIPKIYNTDNELKEDGLLPENSSASITNLNFPSFTTSLLSIYAQRFGQHKFK